jgi:hypothetical protein
MPWRRSVALAAALWGAAGCTAQRQRQLDRPAAIAAALGRCADVARDGVLGKQPLLRRADRDLDGDGSPELVVADRTLCTAAGNCHWNLFTRPRSGGEDCPRYAGTVEAYGIETLASRGDHGFADLRAYWRLAADERLLVQRYRFRRGGYRVVDVDVCGRRADRRVVCADDRDMH